MSHTAYECSEWANGVWTVVQEDIFKCTRRHPFTTDHSNNGEMVDRLIHEGSITTALVECAFRAVDRKNYLGGIVGRYICYQETTWRSENLYLSPPCIYAEIMEGLSLEAGLSFLHVGSGTGYLNTLAGIILGGYGINHGVEIKPDVVRFAEKKLKKFKDTSSALHKLEFCEPKFVVGNCFLLDEGTILYDRVYCGSSIPTTYTGYMKNLVKIGGIIIMALNGQLVKITRTGEETWDQIDLFAVTFDPIILPDPRERKNAVTLPGIQPMKLQEICRLKIRRSIRSSMEAKYSFLKGVTRIPLQENCIDKVTASLTKDNSANTIIFVWNDYISDDDSNQSVTDTIDYIAEFLEEFNSSDSEETDSNKETCSESDKSGSSIDRDPNNEYLSGCDSDNGDSNEEYRSECDTSGDIEGDSNNEYHSECDKSGDIEGDSSSKCFNESDKSDGDRADSATEHYCEDTKTSDSIKNTIVMWNDCNSDNDSSQSVTDTNDYIAECLKEFDTSNSEGIDSIKEICSESGTSGSYIEGDPNNEYLSGCDNDNDDSNNEYRSECDSSGDIEGDSSNKCSNENDVSDGDREADSVSEHCWEIKESDSITKIVTGIYGMLMDENICDLTLPERLKLYLKCRSSG